MGIKNYRPTSAGMRFRTGLTFDEITNKRPEKGLSERTQTAAAAATTPAELPPIIAAAGISASIV